MLFIYYNFCGILRYRVERRFSRRLRCFSRRSRCFSRRRLACCYSEQNASDGCIVAIDDRCLLCRRLKALAFGASRFCFTTRRLLAFDLRFELRNALLEALSIVGGGFSSLRWRLDVAC